MNLFIHHRDIRYQDNTTMIKMYKEINEPIIPIFIFPPEQIDPKKNKYFSDNLVQFMCESLEELDGSYKKKESRLHLFEGDNIEVLDKKNKTSKFNIENSTNNSEMAPIEMPKKTEIVQKLALKKQVKITDANKFTLKKFMNWDEEKLVKTLGKSHFVKEEGKLKSFSVLPMSHVYELTCNILVSLNLMNTVHFCSGLDIKTLSKELKLIRE